jgi:hypothetical protein
MILTAAARKCPKCGESLHELAQFCPACGDEQGARVASSAVPVVPQSRLRERLPLIAVGMCGCSDWGNGGMVPAPNSSAGAGFGWNHEREDRSGETDRSSERRPTIAYDLAELVAAATVAPQGTLSKLQM